MNKTEDEKERLRRQNERLNEQFADLLGNVFPSYAQPAGLTHDDGTPVQFDLGDNQNLYRFYRDDKTSAYYCYTPWKCTKGWYWSWIYAPKGKDSLAMKRAVKHRKRKAAKKRAYTLYAKANPGHGSWD